MAFKKAVQDAMDRAGVIQKQVAYEIKKATGKGTVSSFNRVLKSEKATPEMNYLFRALEMSGKKVVVVDIDKNSNLTNEQEERLKEHFDKRIDDLMLELRTIRRHHLDISDRIDNIDERVKALEKKIA